MTNFERWLLRRIFRRAVSQGPNHFKNTTVLYQMIRDAWTAEFIEDNAPTVSSCLSECFEDTQLWPFGKP